MPADGPLVLITGATGAIGPSMVRQARAAGCRVRILTRQPALAPSMDVESCVGDIRDEAVLRRAVSGVDVVFHLAAVLHVTESAQEASADYEGINARATGALAQLAVAAAVKRMVLFSTIAVYGAAASTMADEDTTPRPVTRYARSKLDAETTLLSMRRPDGVAFGVALRLAAVYGPRVKGNYRAMLKHLQAGRPMPLLPGSNHRTLVYEEDVAAAAMLAACEPGAAGKVFNVTDGTTHTLREISDAMCAALGRSRPRVGVPAGLAAAVITLVRPALPRKLRDVAARVEKFAETVRVDGGRMQRELGFVPRVALDQGWARTVAELHRAGDGI